MKGSDNIGKIRGFILLMILLAIMWSCKKNEKYDLNADLNVANDIVIAQRPVIHAFRMLVRALEDSALQQSHHTFFDGASVTYDPGQNSYSFYFMGMYCPDSVIRTGRIETYIDGDFFSEGTSVRITFNNYKEDGMNITGSDSLVNAGLSGNNMIFSNSFENGVIIKDTVGTIRFRAIMEYQVQVSPPGGYLQTMISVFGTMEGTSSKGFAFSSEISEPLAYPVYSSWCAWIREGSILFSGPGSSVNSGTIYFPPVTSCNDSVYYDFGVTTYRWRMNPKYLNH
jgi:hypothetical protein